MTMVLDRDPKTRSASARLSWESLSGEPVSATAIFDGAALEVRDPSVIALPHHDPDSLHHLRVELEFPGSLRSAAEMVFGGQYGDTVSTELTAFPVTLEPRRELPTVDEMQSWFRSGGEPLRVHAAEKGLAEIVVVRSPAAKEYLQPTMLRALTPRRPIPRKDHRLRFVGVRPTVVMRDRNPFVVFPRSEESEDRTLGLRHLLRSTELPGGPAAEARLCDAVAVAGALAHRSARRRAVVLITSGDSKDASGLNPERVRRYLSSIGVPLMVWNPKKGGKEAGRWGPARNVSTDSLLDNAYRELSRELDRQRIVWLDGLYLPQTIVVDPDVEGVRALR